MAKKTRQPDRLGHADYLSFYLEIINFKDREVAAGTWPAHLTADLVTLHANFQAALVDYTHKRKYRIKEASPALDDATLPLYKRILSLVEALPTLFDGDKTVLAEFGIAGDIPSDRDDLFLVATSCVDHWNSLHTPDVPPEYLPVVPFFDDLLVLYPAFSDARLGYINALRDEEEAQDLVLSTREECHHAERLIFHWYSALWLDPKDENWTHTPWGTSSGGGGEEPGGELPEIPDKPEGVYANFMTEPVIAMLVGCGKYGEHTGFDVVRAVTPAGVTETPTRPEELFATNIDIINEPLLDTDIDPGYRYWYWVRARNGDEVGEWSEVVWVEYL